MISRIRAMRHLTAHQWALVLEPQPPEYPLGETLVFPPFGNIEDERLKALDTSALVDVLLAIAHRDGVEHHELTGNVRDITTPKRFHFKVNGWTRIGFESGLAASNQFGNDARKAQNVVTAQLGLPLAYGRGGRTE